MKKALSLLAVFVAVFVMTLILPLTCFTPFLPDHRAYGDYRNESKFQMEGTVKLSDRNFTADDSFSVSITASPGTPLPSRTDFSVELTPGTNSADFRFDEIVFTEDHFESAVPSINGEREVEFTYVVQAKTSMEEISNFDTLIRIITVTATEAGDGNIHIRISPENGERILFSSLRKITGTVTWEDGGKSHDNAREITLELKRISRKPGSAEEVLSDQAPVWNGNTYVFSGLAAYEDDEYEYTYDVSEKVIPDGYVSSKNGFDFTNTCPSASVTAEPKARTLTYNMSEQVLIEAGAASGGTMKYAIGLDGDKAPTDGYLTTLPKGTDAGPCYVWYMVEGDSSHRDIAPKCVECQIAPWKVQFVWSSRTLIYNGGSQWVPYVRTKDYQTGADIVLQDAQVFLNGGGTDANAGSETPYQMAVDRIVLRGEDITGNFILHDASHDFYIYPKLVGVSWGDQSVFTWDGKAHMPDAAVTGGVLEKDTCEISGVEVYRKDDSGRYVKVDEATERGEYLAEAVLSNPNYTTVDEFSDPVTYQSKEFSIVKGPAAVRRPPTGVKRIWDDETAPLMTDGGEAEGGTMYYALGESMMAPVGGWSKEIPGGKETGVYYIWYKVVGDDNHTDSEPAHVMSRIWFPVTFRIVGGTWSDGKNGDIHLDISRYPDGDLLLKLEDTDIPSGSPDGDHHGPGYWSDPAPDTETAITEARTYTLTFPEKELASVTLKPEPANLIYNSADQDLVAAGEASGGTMKYAVGKDRTNAPADGYSGELPKGKDAGTYFVWYMVEGDANHYNVSPACVTSAIGKAGIHPAVSIQGWMAGDSPSAPEVTGNDGNGNVEFTYAVRGRNDYSADVPYVPGDYTVKADIAESGNYLGGEATADFTVTERVVIWDMDTLKKIDLSTGESFASGGVTLTAVRGSAFPEKDGLSLLGFNFRDDSFTFRSDFALETIEITGTAHMLNWPGAARTSAGVVWTGSTDRTSFGKNFDGVTRIVFRMDFAPRNAMPEADFVTPGSAADLGDEAFEGIGAYCVQISEGTRKLGSRCFAGCPNLRHIYIPESVESIPEDLLDGCGSLTVYGRGDKARTFAESKGYEYIEIP